MYADLDMYLLWYSREEDFVPISTYANPNSAPLTLKDTGPTPLTDPNGLSPVQRAIFLAMTIAIDRAYLKAPSYIVDYFHRKRSTPQQKWMMLPNASRL